MGPRGRRRVYLLQVVDRARPVCWASPRELQSTARCETQGKHNPRSEGSWRRDLCQPSLLPIGSHSLLESRLRAALCVHTAATELTEGPRTAHAADAVRKGQSDVQKQTCQCTKFRIPPKTLSFSKAQALQWRENSQSQRIKCLLVKPRSTDEMAFKKLV